MSPNRYCYRHATDRVRAVSNLIASVRWPARSICGEGAGIRADAQVRATLWPTRHLHSPMRWFEELYVWPEGFEPTSEQWTRIHLQALQRALVSLEREEVEAIGVTLSYGTLQQQPDAIDSLLEAHELVAHRLALLLRGAPVPAHSRFRVRAFLETLRARQICVGMRVTTPRLAMEYNTFNLVQPEFAKILAPGDAAAGAWESLALEARFSGISERWLIVAGLQTVEQRRRAIQAGIGFGQGSAVRPAQRPVADDPPCAERLFGQSLPVG